MSRHCGTFLPGCDGFLLRVLYACFEWWGVRAPLRGVCSAGAFSGLCVRASHGGSIPQPEPALDRDDSGSGGGLEDAGDCVDCELDAGPAHPCDTCDVADADVVDADVVDAGLADPDPSDAATEADAAACWDCDYQNVCAVGDCAHALGACVQSPSECADDGIACTVAGCDPSAGCRQIPQDALCTDPGSCKVSVCDGTLGCVTSNIPDGTSCGSPSCGQTRQCEEGACVVTGARAADCDL